LKKPLIPEAQFDWLAKAWIGQLPAYVLSGISDDDCAILRIGRQKLVVTTDFLNASPIALEHGLGNYEDLGYLLVGANLADLAGTGAKPIGFLAGITLPKDSSEGQFRMLMKGVKRGLLDYGIPLVGGDT